MKRILSLLLALSLVFGLVACSNEKNTASEPDTSTTTQTETESVNNSDTQTSETDTSDESSSDTETPSNTNSSTPQTNTSKPTTSTTKPSNTTKPSEPSNTNSSTPQTNTSKPTTSTTKPSNTTKPSEPSNTNSSTVDKQQLINNEYIRHQMAVEDINTKKKAALAPYDSQTLDLVIKKKSNPYYEWLTDDLEKECDSLKAEISRIEKLLEDLKLVDSDRGRDAIINNQAKLRATQKNLDDANKQLELRSKLDKLENDIINISNEYNLLLEEENKKYEENMAKLK